MDKIAFDWTASNMKTTGYGLDQNIFHIIKKCGSEDESMTKTERKRLNGFKNNHSIQDMDFEFYKKIVWNLKQFENFYHSRK